MGIPSFFKELVKKHKDTYFGMVEGKQLCDYLFLDYNGIVYKVYGALKEANKINTSLNKVSMENFIIDEVVKYTEHIVNDVVKPKKLLFFSLDGPAPRMKMVQQRSRRFKGYQFKMWTNKQKEKYQIPIETSWDPSANISPGTEFMEKLANKLLDVGKNKGFIGTHGSKLQVLISNSNVPGEGEHKFMPIIRNMRKNKSEHDSPIYIYGGDADLIVLAMSTHKSKITVFREVAAEQALKDSLQNYEFVGLDIDRCRKAFHTTLTKNYAASGKPDIDEIRVLNDYNFLTYLAGNDFIISLPFFKIRRGGLDRVIAVYNQLRPKYDYLIDYHPDTQTDPKIHHEFFREIIQRCAEQEQDLLELQQKNIEKLLRGGRDTRFDGEEEKMSPYKIEEHRYQHWDICSPGNPLYEEYKDEFKKINYKQDPEVWKEEYYRYFAGVSYQNREEFDRVVEDMCVNYIESLIFTMRYYFVGCPSWRWHYRYRVSPFPSDILRVLTNKITNMNKITFVKDDPYTPFQQLLLILPPQMNEIIPKALRPIMNDPMSGCAHYYPEEFKLDAVDGMKYIYTEAILPEIDDEVIMKAYDKLQGDLTESEKMRNIIRSAAQLIK
jgi:5'-3' exonuclease